MAHFLFGGTFDPPHFGHSRIIERLLSLAPASSAITVLPSCHPPAKNPPLLSFEQRATLCELAFLPLDPAVTVSRIEAELTPPSFFIHTVKALFGKGCAYEGQRPVMVIGFDQLRTLHRWFEAEQLFAAVDIWVVDRSSGERADLAGSDSEDRQLIKDQLARFGVALPEGIPLAETFRHQLGEFRYVPFAEPHSSTEVRRCLKAGRLKQVKDWLHPDVFARLVAINP